MSSAPPAAPAALAYVSVIAASVAAVIVVLGWFVTGYLSRLAAAQQIRLQAFDKQLQAFHGPLYFKLHGEETLWTLLREHYRPDGNGDYLVLNEPVTQTQLERFRHWNRHAFFPLLKEVAALIAQHGHLALVKNEEEKKYLTDLYTLTTTFDSLLADWDVRAAAADSVAGLVTPDLITAHQPFGLSFPVGILKYSRDSYKTLQSARRKQLGFCGCLASAESIAAPEIRPFEERDTAAASTDTPASQGSAKISMGLVNGMISRPLPQRSPGAFFVQADGSAHGLEQHVQGANLYSPGPTNVGCTPMHWDALPSFRPGQLHDSFNESTYMPAARGCDQLQDLELGLRTVQRQN